MNWTKEPKEKPEISEKQKENGVIELELCRCGEWAEVKKAQEEKGDGITVGHTSTLGGTAFCPTCKTWWDCSTKKSTTNPNRRNSKEGPGKATGASIYHIMVQVKGIPPGRLAPNI